MGEDGESGRLGDSTLLREEGGVWHKKAAKVAHTSIDTEAAWSKSGWHGWV
jgi:hypothetical protein